MNESAPRGAGRLRLALAVLAVVALLALPFVLWGETFALPLLAGEGTHAGALVAIAIALLTADAVAPVPATLVIMALAAKAGWVAGFVGGTVGLSAGVLAAAWLGRFAGEKLAPRFFPPAELARVQAAVARQLALTLGCLRSVPIAAETSVIVAAATGVPVARIFRVTLLPNALIAAIYSVAADDSLVTAAMAFVATAAASYAAWRIFSRRGNGIGG